MITRETLVRIGFATGALASVAWAALPMARHMAGVVVLETPPPPNIQSGRPQNRPDLGAILALAPFGQLPVASPSNGPPSDKRPDIVLRGIFAAQAAASTALLDVDGEPGLYRETMRIADRLEVTQITPELVNLTDGKRTITLRFDDTEVVADKPSPPPDAAPSLVDRLRGGLVVPAAYQKPGKPETTAEYIDYWRQRVRKNPQAVLDEIGLRPTDDGYVIADTHDVGVRLAGLQAGDLVRSVNGQKVGDPDADRRFYDEIAAAGQARIEVERGGRVLSFSFPLR